MVSVSVLRRANKKSIIKLIRENPEISRKEMASILNVSKNTVSLAVEELIKEGIVAETKIKSNSKGIGRPTVALTICEKALHLGSINVTPGEVRIHIYNYNLELVQDYKFPFNRTIQQLANYIQLVVTEWPNLIGITIIIPGIVMSSDGLVIYSEKLNWRKVDLIQQLSKNITIPIYLQNNVKCIGMYQSWKLRTDEAIYYIKIDTSVGSAIIVNRQVWMGFKHLAGEISHIKLQDGKTLEESINISVYKKANVDGRNDIVSHAAQQIAQIIKNAIVLINPNRIIIESEYCQEKLFINTVSDILKRQLLEDLIETLEIDFHPEISDSIIGGAIHTIYEYERIESIL